MYYKTSFLLNILSPLVLNVGQFLLWGALFSMGYEKIGDYNQNEMFTHLMLAFVIQQCLTWSSENAVSRDIRSGNIVSKIIRPTPLIIQNMGEMIGKVIPQALFNISIAIIAFLVFNSYLIIPNLGTVILSIISLLLAVILRMVFVNCFSLLCFFTTNHLGITWTRNAISEFFSGAIIPILLFPKWLKQIADVTPFPLMLQTTINIFIGKKIDHPVYLTFILQII